MAAWAHEERQFLRVVRAENEPRRSATDMVALAMTGADNNHGGNSADRGSYVNCIAHTVKYGVSLRCTRLYKHKGRHKWAKDDNIYPVGRLDPDDPFDQALVAAFNRGLSHDRR
jgi:hypothetical protein